MGHTLNLTRPLVFFDLETTGVNVAVDRIVEISVVKAMPGGDIDTKTRRVNPTISIPEGASEVHGIYDKDVKDCPTFEKIAKSLWDFIQGCDIAGFNSNRFDVPLLVEEFLRAGISPDFTDVAFVDVQLIYHKHEERTLSAAYKFYCDKVLEDAHSAEADTLATLEIFQEQIKRYSLSEDLQDLDTTYTRTPGRIDFAGKFVRDENGEIVFTFGKHKELPVKVVFFNDPSYIRWFMNSTDNTRDTINKLDDIITGRMI